MEQDIVGILI